MADHEGWPTPCMAPMRQGTRVPGMLARGSLHGRSLLCHEGACAPSLLLSCPPYLFLQPLLS